MAPDDEEVGFGDGLDASELLGMDVEPSEGGDPSPDAPESEDGAPDLEPAESGQAEGSSEGGESASEPDAGRSEPEAEATEKPPVDTSGDITGTVEVFGKTYENGRQALHALKSQVGQYRALQANY